MKKDNEVKPKCIAVSASTWTILRDYFGDNGVVGYLILKVNVNRVTYSVHKVHGMNTLNNNGEMINICIGDQIADRITLKCDDSGIDFFVKNHGNFIFMVNHKMGIIQDGSVKFEDLEWAQENNHLQSYLDEVFND